MSLVSSLRQRLSPIGARRAAALLAPALLLALTPPISHAQPVTTPSFFNAAELDGQRFLVVAAPIGTSSRYQLNIYEQVNTKRPCFAVAAGRPASVNPLLGTFDFTGICGRYIDGNGYSLRVGGSDQATAYRLSVVAEKGDTLLMALPTRPGAGPEMVVARAFGQASGFLKLELEPGWRLMRRQFRGRNLGHLYVYRDSWPDAAATAPSPSAPLPGVGSGALPGASKPAVRPLPPMAPR